MVLGAEVQLIAVVLPWAIVSAGAIAAFARIRTPSVGTRLSHRTNRDKPRPQEENAN